jgi:hypothetical protein
MILPHKIFDIKLQVRTCEVKTNFNYLSTKFLCAFAANAAIRNGSGLLP